MTNFGRPGARAYSHGTKVFVSKRFYIKTRYMSGLPALPASFGGIITISAEF